MKFATTAALLPAVYGTVLPSQVFSEETMAAFNFFKTTYNKVYESEQKEFSALAAFASNLIKAEERNALGGAQHGVTQFMDLTPEEFKSQYLNYQSSRSGENRIVQGSAGLPVAAARVDWTTNSTLGFNVISPVKDQGRCGSCWAFSATEQIETVYAMKTGTDAPKFSTQQIVACDTLSLGCNGGDTVTAFQYIRKNGGIERASDYPDTSSSTGRTGSCLANRGNLVPNTAINQIIFCLDECVSGSCDTTSADTEKAKACITAAPQSICVNAESWQTYISGVMTDRECGSHGARALDHCVQVVGYETEASTPYYVVRNSWNTKWGNDGMIYLAMDGNTCGILDEMTTVTLA